jgi:hypothetical protein
MTDEKVDKAQLKEGAEVESSGQAEKTQIDIQGADDLYREIRIDKPIGTVWRCRAQTQPHLTAPRHTRGFEEVALD